MKNFVEIALCSTVFEILAFLCFAIFAQKFENSKWPPFLARQIFFENWHGYSSDNLRVKNFVEIDLSSTVFEIQAFLCFAILRKIRKFKMAAIFCEKFFV